MQWCQKGYRNHWTSVSSRWKDITFTLYHWRGFHSLIFPDIIHLSIYLSVLSSMHRPLHLSSVHPSITCCINSFKYPPTKSTQTIQWAHYIYNHLAFVDQRLRVQHRTLATSLACWWASCTLGRRAGGARWKHGEGPSVRSHWGQRMAATFTKANSPEEQSASPVAVDYSIITSTSPTVSHSNHLLFKIHTTCRMVGAMKC